MMSKFLETPTVGRSTSSEDLIELDDMTDESATDTKQRKSDKNKEFDEFDEFENELENEKEFEGHDVSIPLPSDEDEPYTLKYNFFENDEKKGGMINDIVNAVSRAVKMAITQGEELDRESYLKSSARALLLYAGFVAVSIHLWVQPNNNK